MTFSELRYKFDSDVKELQATCQHEKVSDWMMYDDGGFPRWCGRDARVCECCNKVIEDRKPSILFMEMVNGQKVSMKITRK